MGQRIQDFNFTAKYIDETTGADAVIITRGKAGSIDDYSSEQGYHSSLSLALNVKDRVGAGGVFLGILLPYAQFKKLRSIYCLFLAM